MKINIQTYGDESKYFNNKERSKAVIYTCLAVISMDFVKKERKKGIRHINDDLDIVLMILMKNDCSLINALKTLNFFKLLKGIFYTLNYILD